MVPWPEPIPSFPFVAGILPRPRSRLRNVVKRERIDTAFLPCCERPATTRNVRGDAIERIAIAEIAVELRLLTIPCRHQPQGGDAGSLLHRKKSVLVRQ